MKIARKEKSWESFKENFPLYIADLNARCKKGVPFVMQEILNYRKINPAIPLTLKRLGVLKEIKVGGRKLKYEFDLPALIKFEPNSEKLTEYMYVELQRYNRHHAEIARQRLKAKQEAENKIEYKVETVMAEDRTMNIKHNERLFVIGTVNGLPHVERCDFSYYEQLGILKILVRQVEQDIQNEFDLIGVTPP